MLSDVPRGIGLNTAWQTDRWFTAGRFMVFLGFVVFAAFPKVILGSAVFVYRDFGLFGYPLASFARESFWRGEWPLWNPLSNCGIPFLAQWNTLVLYPGSLLYLLLPLPWSLSFFSIIHLWWAGVGMFLLASSWTGNRLAGAMAGAGFAFNGFSLSSVMWPNYIAALAWMPWVVWLVGRGWREGKGRLVAGALVGAVHMLTGAPEIILLTWVLLLVLLGGDLVCVPMARLRVLGRFLFMVLLVAGLAAAQLLPFLDLLQHSDRSAAFAQDRWAMPAWGWANLWVPLFHCHESEYGVYVQNGQNMVTSYYPGIALLALAFVALLRAPKWQVWVLMGVVLLALVLALGDNAYVYVWLREVMPALGFIRFPVKFAVLPVFLIPLVAAYGVAWLRKADGTMEGDAWRSVAMVWLGFLALMIVLGCISFGYPLADEQWRMTTRNATVRATYLTAVLALLFLLSRFAQNGVQGVARVVLVGLVAWDGLSHEPVLNPTVPPEVYASGYLQLTPQPQPGESRAYLAMQAHRPLYRLLPDLAKCYAGYRLGGLENTTMLDHVPTPDGFYALYLGEQRELWRQLFFKPGPSDERLLDFMGIAQISTNTFEWQARPSPMPLITAGQRPIFTTATNALRAMRAPAFDPRETVFLPPEAQATLAATNRSDAEVLNYKFSAHRIEAEIASDAPAVVSVAQSFYPRWRAYVNGRATRLWRANFAFQAVEVRAGRSKVLLVYRDRAFRLGGAVTAASLLLVAGLILRWGRSRRET